MQKIEQSRFYLTSLIGLASQLGRVIRGYWGVESLHWIMDTIFRDDECRARTDHAPANFTTLKHMAHNLIREAPGKDAWRLRRKVAVWDDEFASKFPHRMILAPDSPVHITLKEGVLFTLWLKPKASRAHFGDATGAAGGTAPTAAGPCLP